jgi:hypothetical protein
MCVNRRPGSDRFWAQGQEGHLRGRSRCSASGVAQAGDRFVSRRCSTAATEGAFIAQERHRVVAEIGVERNGQWLLGGAWLLMFDDRPNM